MNSTALWISISYFGLGMFLFLLVYAFPGQYRALLKRSLLIIKTAGLKSKQAQAKIERERKKLPQEDSSLNLEEIETEQKAYSQKLDEDIAKKTVEYQESSEKATRALFGLIVAWPLLMFILTLSVIMESVYLTEAEVAQVENQI